MMQVPKLNRFGLKDREESDDIDELCAEFTNWPVLNFQNGAPSKVSLFNLFEIINSISLLQRNR